MSENEFLYILDKRLENNVSITPVGSDAQWERYLVCIETHRLIPCCPTVRLRYIMKAVRCSVFKQSPIKKHVLAADAAFYNSLLAIVGERTMPKPRTEDIKTSLHKAVRLKLSGINKELTAALSNVQSLKTLSGSARMAASDETKAGFRTILAKEKERARIFYNQEVNNRVGDILAKEKDRARIVYTKDINKVNKIKAAATAKPTAVRKPLTYIAKEDETPSAGAIYVSHIIRLSPNNRQKTYLDKCFGVSRFCYNWCYDRWQDARRYDIYLFTSDLYRKFNSIYHTEYPFVGEVLSAAKRSGFDSFRRAQNNFFAGRGVPQRKRRKNGGSFHYHPATKYRYVTYYNPNVSNGTPSNKRAYLLVPTFGYIKMMEKPRYEGCIKRVTIKKTGSHYYAVLNILVTQDEWARLHQSVTHCSKTPLGIDVGVKDFAILSNGVKISHYDACDNLYSRKRHLQQLIANCRKAHPQRTSKRQKALGVLLADLRHRIACKSDDFIQKLTTALALSFENISIENLDIRNIVDTNPYIAGKIRNSSFYKFRTLLEQKMQCANHNLHVADKYLPTTRTCSVCGCIGPHIPVSERVFRCNECGAEVDRDINAAINLARLIGLDEPKLDSSDKGMLVKLLTRNGINIHQEDTKKQAGCAT